MKQIQEYKVSGDLCLKHILKELETRKDFPSLSLVKFAYYDRDEAGIHRPRTVGGEQKDVDRHWIPLTSTIYDILLGNMQQTRNIIGLQVVEIECVHG